VDRLQMSCEHVSLERRPKTSETVSSVYKMWEDCSKRRRRSIFKKRRAAMFVDEELVGSRSDVETGTEVCQ